MTAEEKARDAMAGAVVIQLGVRDRDGELRRLEEEVLGEALQALGAFYRDVLAARVGGIGVFEVAEEAIRNDPEIQSMMRDWDARIVPGTLKPA